MIFEKLVALAVFKSVPQTLSVRLDLTSSERLQKALSIACALAPWLSESIPIGGTVEPNPATKLSVQNAFRVVSGDGTLGSLFIVNGHSERLSWKSHQAPARCFQFTGTPMVLCEGFTYRSRGQTLRLTGRFASELQAPGAMAVYCPPARMWSHFWNACGPHGRVALKPLSNQNCLWPPKLPPIVR